MSSGARKVTHEARDYLPSNYRGILARLRNERGLGQGKMAESVGVSQSTWSRLENGASALTVEQLAAAAAVLGARPSEILTMADRSAADLRQRGIVVQPKRQSELTETELVLIGATALTILLAAILGKAKK